jgi:FAD/FMN-containing dehydrogenase
VIFAADPDPAAGDRMKDWVVESWDATHPFSAGGAYVNFLGDEGQGRIRAAYRDNFERLVRIKQQVDPKNLFRLNQNIRPAA